jgi:hypothetical protein
LQVCHADANMRAGGDWLWARADASPTDERAVLAAKIAQERATIRRPDDKVLT